MSKTDKNEITVIEQTALPAHLLDFEEDAGKGVAEGGADDYAIPYLQIVQTNSPQLDKRDGKYIEGISSGDIFNTVTLEFSESLMILPVYYERWFMEWEPRTAASKAPVGRYKFEDQFVQDALARKKGPKGEVYSGNGENILVDTRYHYVLVVRDDGTFYPALIALSSTGLTVSKRLNSLIKAVTGPSGKTLASFCRKYKFRSVPKSNDKGKWNLADFSYGDFLPNRSHPLYAAANAFYESVKKGDVKVDESGLRGHDSESEFTGDLADVEDDGVM